MQEHDQQHYLKHVTELGDQRQIVALEDIYAKTGIKLVAKHHRINSSIYKKLLEHKLMKPLESSLTIDDCLTTGDLSKTLHEMARDNILLQAIMQSSEGNNPIDIIDTLSIPEPLRFNLTVLKERLESVYLQSLMVSLTAIYLAKQLDMSKTQVKSVAFAGIFQNIGMLYIEPDIFDKPGDLSYADRKQIYSHPIIASLILNTHLDSPLIGQYVMDHHERTDGSGYPRGLSEDKISEGGSILSVAELTVSLSEKSDQQSYKSKIEAILKFNSEGYSKAPTNKLLTLISTIQEKTSQPDELDHQAMIFDKLAMLWNAIHNFSDKGQNEAGKFLSEQLYTLKQNLTMSGLTQDLVEMDEEDIKTILQEPGEILALTNEAVYKLKKIISEVRRRWVDRIEFDIKYRNIAQWLYQVEDQFPSAPAHAPDKKTTQPETTSENPSTENDPEPDSKPHPTT